MKKTALCLSGILVAGMALADISKGLVLKYTCDEFSDSGTILPDVTSNNNGRVVGAKFAASGRLNGGCEFSGSNSYIHVPASPLLDSKKVTACLWFKTAKADDPDRTLIDKRADAGYAIRLATGDKNSMRRGKIYATVAGRDCFSDAALADNAWHHAALTYDGETVRLYIDGALQKQTVAWKGEIGAAGQDLFLGMNRSNPSAKERTASFEGSVDEVLVFDRPLSEAEIKEVIDSTRPRFTRGQVERRIREIQELYDRGLLTKEFYDRKIKECEAGL